MGRIVTVSLLVLPAVLAGIPAGAAWSTWPQDVKAVEWWMSLSDEETWNWIPDLVTHGISHGDWGCPVCGKKIFTGRGHYPWLWHPDRPYKVECPECHRRFPSNDYHKWMLEGRKQKLDTTQPYVDDGNGYIGPDGTNYKFVQYAIGRASAKGCVWSMIMDAGIPKLAASYASTGDEAYARRCALIMARIATEYPSLNPDRGPHGTLEEVKKLPYRLPASGDQATLGGFQAEGSWLPKMLRSYRQIMPYLNKDGDAQLRDFLAEKGITGVKSLITWDFCHQIVLGGLQGNYVHSFGMGIQDAMVKAALDWDMHDPTKGATTEYLIDWVLHTGPHSVDRELYNSYNRDGFGACEALGYNFGGGLRYFTPFAETAKAAGVMLYDHPRVRELMRAPTKVIVAGKWAPQIGDGGRWKGADTKGYWDPRYMGPPFAATSDPVLARALANGGKELGEYKEQVAAVIAEVGSDITWESRNFSPFGLAIFESGAGDYRRGLSCYYGGTTAHGHYDRLTFDLFNKRGPVTPDLGHPGYIGNMREGWGNHTVSHNTVMVDAHKQLNREPGYLQMFAATPTVQALQVNGEAAYRGICTKFSRTLVYVDTDEKNSYLVDIFRVAGGSQHDYGIHGASHQVAIEGLDTVAQQGGCLAGPDIEYLQFYDAPPRRYKGSGYQYLSNVARGTPQGDFVATWDHWQEGTPFLRIHVPAGNAEQALFADGLPAFADKDEAIRFMYLRNGHAPPLNEQQDGGKRLFPVGDLESTFVTVLEPLYDEAFITKVGRLTDVEGLGEADVALSIERADGATDLLVCLEEPGEVTVRGMKLSGRLALATSAGDGKPTRMALLDGSAVSLKDTSVQLAGPTAGVVSTVDYDAMTVTVPEKLPEGQNLAGKTIIFDTPPRSSSFAIDSVEAVAEGSRLKLRACDAIAYRSEIESADNEKSTVTLCSRLNILHAGTALAGMRLYNEDRSVGVRIDSFHRRGNPNWPWPPFGGIASVEEGHDVEAAFVDRDGDGQAMATVYEFGPGDTYRITPTACLASKE